MKKLLTWFQENQRLLPWRKTYDPYQVWISEIMLQQTQVKTVLPYFDRWMKKLPTIQSVADAKEDTVLKLWEGLGYYSRARNLQKAARQIVEKHGGEFPSDFESILSFPGVGRYTACAIASIAFNQDYPVVDGNVIRVLSRLFHYSENTRLPAAEKWMWGKVEDLLPKGKARNFNQGMMELGALICTPKSPKCEACPLVSECMAKKKGVQESLPNRGPRKVLTNIKVAIAVIRKGDKVFIQKRPEKGLMGGLWEFPGGKVEKGERPEVAVLREVSEEVGVKLRELTKLREIKHAYTSFKVDLHCFEANYASGRVRLKSATEGKWVEISDLKKYPFPAANVSLISQLLQ
jgi:A/G-specific adenine glycosylase